MVCCSIGLHIQLTSIKGLTWQYLCLSFKVIKRRRLVKALQHTLHRVFIQTVSHVFLLILAMITLLNDLCMRSDHSVLLKDNEWQNEKKTRNYADFLHVQFFNTCSPTCLNILCIRCASRCVYAYKRHTCVFTHFFTWVENSYNANMIHNSNSLCP